MDISKTLLKSFSATVNKQGKPLKQCNILDCGAIIKECEEKIRAMKVDEFTYSQKASFSAGVFGIYISIISGKRRR